MRTKFNLAIVVALLFFGLGALEFPELLTLTDDTSNDFALVISGQTASRDANTVKAGPAGEAIRLSPSQEFSGVRNPFEFREVPHSFLSATDYLDFLCTYRT
jgi:hypothetical protein